MQGMSQPHILFRFHKSFDVCKQKLELLRRMNPDMPIHGMYGGVGGVEAVPDFCKDLLDTLYALPFEDKLYSWRNGDICVRWWYKEEGHKHDFSHICVAEWDLLYLKPLYEIYHGFSDECTNYIALSADYQTLYDDGWPWIQGFFERAVSKLEKDTGIHLKDLSFGIMGGVALCRAFLDKYAAEPIASYCNDEVRLSVYTELFGMKLKDIGFLTDKRNIIYASDFSYSYGVDDIKCVKEAGGFALHPIRVVIPDLENLITIE